MKLLIIISHIIYFCEIRIKKLVEVSGDEKWPMTLRSIVSLKNCYELNRYLPFKSETKQSLIHHFTNDKIGHMDQLHVSGI